MLDDDNTSNETAATEGSAPEGSAAEDSGTDASAAAPAKKTAAKKSTTRKTAAKKTATKTTAKTTAKSAAKKTAAKKTAPVSTDADQPALDVAAPAEAVEDPAPVKKTAARKTTAAKKTAAKRTTTRKSTASKTEAAGSEAVSTEPDAPDASEPATEAEAPATAMLFQAPEKPKATRRTRKVAAPAEDAAPAEEAQQDAAATGDQGTVEQGEQAQKAGEKKKSGAKKTGAKKKSGAKKAEAKSQGGEDTTAETAAGDELPRKKSGKSGTSKKGTPDPTEKSEAGGDATDEQADEKGQDKGQESHSDGSGPDDGDEASGGPRRRRRRGGRRRRKSSDADGDNAEASGSDDGDDDGADGANDDSGEGSGGGSRRRRRRRRAGDSSNGASDDPENTVTRVRQSRSAEDQITAVTGSTRLEAKKQRRREGREAGRRRAPIVSEAEFLARREAVDRVMVIRQRKELTQIAVLEDKVLVEHYVARESQTSLIGNVYVGRVQNVLPSMEAAFVDIGKGRNAVIYAGEVNWAALGHKDGQPRKIESVLTSGQSILVQVTKDPIGHKGARLTGQVSLAGRFLVYVPDGTTSGISRKLPDTERSRLKSLLKEIVPDTAGVIVRTAAEGASEEELTQDVERLKARWEDIESKSKSGGPKLLYGEPDLTLKVVRDLFTEDFSKLVIEGETAWETVHGYVSHVAPDLEDRLERFASDNGSDSFAAYRIDEQIAKGVDRKVWLPSGGSLIIDRTEAMTVVDVNTGKFTGSGGNLEETVTKNNLEAAEEIVRQLRLRDIGGIIVVDFIDMVLESNRDLVLRRLVECLGRDRTRHQVAEVTSLGLVQMTRKRIGTGLLEAFSEDCEHCQGRGLIVHDMPIEPKKAEDDRGRSGGRRGRGRGKGGDSNNGGGNAGGKDQSSGAPSPKDVAAVAKPENADKPPVDEIEPSAPAETKADEKPQESPEVPSVAQPEVPEPAAAQPEVPQPAVQEPVAATEAPKVVTRTRRRASRPTGVSTPTPAEAITVTSPATPAPSTADAVEPVAPKVVTTTRSRRGASRSTAAAKAQGADAPDTSGAEAQTEPAAELHVPVKKKGSRKR